MDKATRKAMEKHMAEVARRPTLVIHALDALEQALDGLHPNATVEQRMEAAREIAKVLDRAGRRQWIARHRAMSNPDRGVLDGLAVERIRPPAPVVSLDAVRSARRPRPEVPS